MTFQGKSGTLPKTNSSRLKMDGWLEDEISYWGKRPIFRGELAVFSITSSSPAASLDR